MTVGWLPPFPATLVIVFPDMFSFDMIICVVAAVVSGEILKILAKFLQNSCKTENPKNFRVHESDIVRTFYGTFVYWST